MQPREKLKSEEYWQEWLEDNDETIDMFQPLITAPDRTARDHLEFAKVVYSAWYEKIYALYSAGAPCAEAEETFYESLKAFATFFDLAKKDSKYAIEEYFFAYDERTIMLSMAILFGVSDEERDMIVEAVDFWPKKDAIWEKMIAFLGVSGRPQVTEIQWPALYEPLWQVFEAPPMQRLPQLTLFLDNWYPEMGRGDKYWHDYHKSEHDIYFGYWCFEAAAVSKMLEIDDRNLQEQRLPL